MSKTRGKARAQRKETSRRSPDTRLALLRAAERLFAARGVDAVSLREIAAAADQGNHSAALYHFESKKQLLDALLDRHSDPLQIAWQAALNEPLDPRGRRLDDLVSLLVRPLVSQLDDPDGGTEYLLVVADLVTSRSFPLLEMPATSSPGILALTSAIREQAAAFPAHLLALRMMRVAAVLYCSIADYHRLIQAGLAVPREEFVNDLIGSLVSLLGERGASTTSAWTI